MRTIDGRTGTNLPSLLSRSSSSVPFARLGLAAAAFAGIGVAAGSCSLIAGGVDANQCQVDADCTGAFAGRTCQSGVCVCPAGQTCGGTNTGGSGGGSVNSDCPSGKNAECTHLGSTYICNKATKKCANLVYNDKDGWTCDVLRTTSHPNDPDAYQDDNAVLFGAVIPTSSPQNKDFGILIESAAKLAIDDFGKVNGIPSASGSGNRPLVLIGCDSGPNEDQTDKAGRYLSETIGVPAILGYPFSGNTISLATDVTIPDGVLLMSPSATSNDITQLDEQHSNKDLVWRTAPRDDAQASALAVYYPTVEKMARQLDPNIPTNGIKVAILNHSDAYGSGLGDVLQGILTFNGKSATSQGGPGGNYGRFDYGPSNSPNLTKVTEVTTFNPDIIFLFGFNEGPDTLLMSIESQGLHPIWVMSDGGQVSTLWAPNPETGKPAVIGNDDLRQRVTGTVPGVSTGWSNYANFRIHWYASEFGKMGSPDTLGPSGAYDIMYLFAYSAIAVGNKPLTGTNMVTQGLRKMVGGGSALSFNVDSSKVTAPFTQLASGQTVNIEGASGALDFDKYGDVTSDIQIWCVPPNDNPPPVGSAAIYSGKYYDHAGKTILGSFDPQCGLTKFAGL